MPITEKISTAKAELENLSREASFSQPSAGPSTAFKFSIFVVFLLSLASLAFSGLLYQTLNSERRERQALEGAQDQIREKSVTLEKVTGVYKTQIEELQGRLKNYEEERGQFKKAIDDNRSLITTLQAKLKAAEELKAKALELRKKAEASAALPPVSAEPVQKSETVFASGTTTAVAQPASSPKTPQVLTVNRKFNFVVISIGVKDGLQMGDPIEILREEKPVANAEVEKLYENFAAATIVRESKDIPIKAGDTIRKIS